MQASLDWLDSEEGQASIDRHCKEIINREAIRSSQLERFHKGITNERFDNIIEKLLAKYSSNAYKDRWYKRGIEPPESLLYFLYDYAEKYGRESTKEEDRRHANTFTSGLYMLGGWWFMLCVGQGSFIKIWRMDYMEGIQIP